MREALRMKQIGEYGGPTDKPVQETKSTEKPERAAFHGWVSTLR